MRSESIHIPGVGNGSGIEPDERVHREELQLAFRNKAMPLEALRYELTPIGMHYTLTHYDVPSIDVLTWRLGVSGRVRNRLSLTYNELRQRPELRLPVTLECAGDGRALLYPRPISQPWLYGGVGTAEWTGTSLRLLLEEAGIEENVREILFTGVDHGIEGGVEQDYQRSLPLKVALNDDVLLAWAMNETTLEPQHGYPLRLIVPGWYGMASVKWLRSIEAITDPFEGYQQAVAYRYSQSRDEAGDPVSSMRVRSLMIPPGFPDYLTRLRIVERGRVELRGRAWSGEGHITRVEMSTDGGVTWQEARVGEPSSRHSWQSWWWDWDVSLPGTYELCCRAHDSAGNAQPLEQHWTARGMGNNVVHRVQVVVV